MVDPDKAVAASVPVGAPPGGADDAATAAAKVAEDEGHSAQDQGESSDITKEREDMEETDQVTKEDEETETKTAEAKSESEKKETPPALASEAGAEGSEATDEEAKHDGVDGGGEHQAPADREKNEKSAVAQASVGPKREIEAIDGSGAAAAGADHATPKKKNKLHVGGNDQEDIDFLGDMSCLDLDVVMEDIETEEAAAASSPGPLLKSSFSPRLSGGPLADRSRVAQAVAESQGITRSASLATEGLPQVEAPEGMSPGAVKAARMALSAGDRPELFNLCVVKPKGGKSAYCKCCRSMVESAKAYAKQQDERDGTEQAYNRLLSLEKAKDPTRFRMQVFDFEESTNTDGSCSGRSGKKRTSTYDMLQYEEFWESQTRSENWDKLRPLTHFKFIKHFTEEEGDTPEEAQARWTELFNSKCPRDNKGKNGEVRLKVKVDEFELHGSALVRGNRAAGAVKGKKNPTNEDLDAMKGNLGTRQEAHEDDFFEPLGGGEELREVEGVNTKSAFMKGGNIVLQAETKKRKSSDGEGAEMPLAKTANLGKLKDRESKLNKLRNDLGDKVCDVEKEAEAVLEKESDMKGILSEEEAGLPDFAPLLKTLEIRIAGLQIISKIDNGAEATETFESFGLISAIPPKDEEPVLTTTKEHLATLGRLGVASLFASLLTANKKALPSLEFGSTTPVADLKNRVPDLGEGSNTVSELKEVNKEFLGQIERVRDAVKNTKRAGEDIAARKAAKAAREQREAAKLKNQAKAAEKATVKAQERADQKAMKTVAAQKAMTRKKDKTGVCGVVEFVVLLRCFGVSTWRVHVCR